MLLPTGKGLEECAPIEGGAGEWFAEARERVWKAREVAAAARGDMLDRRKRDTRGISAEEFLSMQMQTEGKEAQEPGLLAQGPGPLPQGPGPLAPCPRESGVPFWGTTK